MSDLSNRMQTKRLEVHFGIILFIATYLLLTARSVLGASQAADLLSLKRLLATIAGLFLFALIARASRSWNPQLFIVRMPKILMFLATSAAIVLAIRIGYDLYLPNRSETFLQDNLRWIIAWLGYFIAAVFGYFAISFSVRLATALANRPRISDKELRNLVLIRSANWQSDERLALAQALAKVPVYEEADPIEVHGFKDNTR